MGPAVSWALWDFVLSLCLRRVPSRSELRFFLLFTLLSCEIVLRGHPLEIELCGRNALSLHVQSEASVRIDLAASPATLLLVLSLAPVCLLPCSAATWLVSAASLLISLVELRALKPWWVKPAKAPDCSVIDSVSCAKRVVTRNGGTVEKHKSGRRACRRARAIYVGTTNPPVGACCWISGCHVSRRSEADCDAPLQLPPPQRTVGLS